jgi:hypothetical protein
MTHEMTRGHHCWMNSGLVAMIPDRQTDSERIPKKKGTITLCVVTITGNHTRKINAC